MITVSCSVTCEAIILAQRSIANVCVSAQPTIQGCCDNKMVVIPEYHVSCFEFLKVGQDSKALMRLYFLPYCLRTLKWNN